MFLSKQEKVVILLLRVEYERNRVLLGVHDDKSFKKIRKLEAKINKMGYNPYGKVEFT